MNTRDNGGNEGDRKRGSEGTLLGNAGGEWPSQHLRKKKRHIYSKGKVEGSKVGNTSGAVIMLQKRRSPIKNRRQEKWSTCTR